ncbi:MULTISPECIES: type III restriction-modification system endonuclease [unclassified Acinetobacter]|uniref:type III restriction-modification system endonuclease n=1 Tax=unclassified Acinetobacter TaxID=196816 RepID=UPI001B66CED2|nr:MULTISPECIES: type III restriction-modification system endonuclease [unclassified Acinetobacter]MBP6151839.1 type III restriction-modification system endonuclease [Candidatus Methylopumilus sp.]MCH7352426.1 type III restriction-modification system endonuclease [Acinetobacter sp. NIPH 2023]MCH7359819.1 type III restriction-modification system endonuclease [Acinetobacter sp. NIPH 2024]
MNATLPLFATQQTKQFHFEGNLPHQQRAVDSVLAVLENVTFDKPNQQMILVSNPKAPQDKQLGLSDYPKSIEEVQKYNDIVGQVVKPESNVLDISMETGTGKTYTYTKMMFELNARLKLFKFIVVVPTLPIKAGTINFLKSQASQEHFATNYQNKSIRCHVVESQSSKKSKKDLMPQSILDFVQAPDDGQTIHVLVINAGMINSDTLSKKYDRAVFDQFNTPVDAIASIAPMVIIDEPHRFPTAQKTWGNIQKLGGQFIIRYGATFNDDYYNLIYQLTAVDAFNQDLVKGVVAYIEEFEGAKDTTIKLLEIDTSNKKKEEATFQIKNGKSVKKISLFKHESLSVLDRNFGSLTIDNLNKTTVVLSNGLELKKNDVIDPYSYNETLQEKMIRKAIKNHFEMEKQFLTRSSARIKPLSLFFIDNIESYRGKEGETGTLAVFVESEIKQHVRELLKTEKHEAYREYLEKTLKDISQSHGGYFSQDNSEKDEKIEKEIEEILHDKETLLSLDNPRRFIFSKWTLREGWDNPNVFQICKLRSSGGKTSKLQEVGRGLRLPVNEFMQRVKNEDFQLHYYVDFTEKDFVDELINDINSKSLVVFDETKLTSELITQILDKYSNQFADEEALLEHLDNLDAIKRNNDFKEGGLAKLKQEFPLVFAQGVKKDKVRNAGDTRPKATMRLGKYAELKEMWEALNRKVILEYKIDSEQQFHALLQGYFEDNLDSFKKTGSFTKKHTLIIENNLASQQVECSIHEEILPIQTMSYGDFLHELAIALKVNRNTLHHVFLELLQSKEKHLNINQYLSQGTIRSIRSGFNDYLLKHSFHSYQIGLTDVSNTVHPTVFTDEQGKPLAEIESANLGRMTETLSIADNYLFNELFYDSPLEKENICEKVSEVSVFTKIPKNSIRIPIAGGGTYSPDFAYIVEFESGKKTLNLLIETKDKASYTLSEEEQRKIKHAELLFKNVRDDVEVIFKTQFESERIVNIIQQAIR